MPNLLHALMLNVITLICSETDLKRYIQNAVEVDPERPVLVDKYMDRADELDVDALCDKDGSVTICGIMQHIEQAGVHSGMHPASADMLCYNLCLSYMFTIRKMKITEEPVNVLHVERYTSAQLAVYNSDCGVAFGFIGRQSQL